MSTASSAYRAVCPSGVGSLSGTPAATTGRVQDRTATATGARELTVVRRRGPVEGAVNERPKGGGDNGRDGDGHAAGKLMLLSYRNSVENGLAASEKLAPAVQRRQRRQPAG